MPKARQNRRRKLWTVVGLSFSVTVVLAACRADPLVDCQRLLEDEEFAMAAEQCAEVFESTHDPEAGEAAARAQVKLGRLEEALSWVERLRGDSAGGSLWSLEGRIHWRRGDYERAVEAYQIGHAKHLAAGSDGEAARASYALFYIAWQRTRLGEAFRFAARAVEEATRAEEPNLTAKALSGLSTAFYEVGDLASAETALTAAEQITSPEEQMMRARYLVTHGLIRLHESRSELAQQAFERALELSAGRGDRRFYRSVHLNLVKAHLAAGTVDDAEYHLTEAWRNAEPDGSKRTALLYYQAWFEYARQGFKEAEAALESGLSEDPVEDWAWDLEYRLGQTQESLGDLGAAEAAYKRAIEIVEQLRQEVGFEEFKSWVLDERRAPFEALVSLRAREGRATEALEVVETAKARTLLEAFVRAATTASAERDEPVAASAAVERLDALEALRPALSESPVVRPHPIEQVLKASSGHHILVYFQAGDWFWLFRVEGDGVETHLLGDLSQVSDLVNRFRAQPDNLAVAEMLGSLLLPPNVLPKPGSRIEIVTDGMLGGVSFAGLRRQGRFLVEDYALSYIPSVASLLAFSEQPVKSLGDPMVLGDPLGDLPGAAKETADVATLLDVPAAIGEEATLDALLRARQARVLHLATHAGIGPRGPWLALADGKISADRIVQERVAPRLVVLASCASATRRSKGMWGSLGGAFVAAGSKSVLATLWSIEDLIAGEFVSRFYAEGGVADPIAALAHTQRALILEGEPPANWTPFVVFGSDRP